MQKLTEIIPFIEKGYNIQQLAEHFNKSKASINYYIHRLRKAGYTVKIRQGRPPLQID